MAERVAFGELAVCTALPDGKYGEPELVAEPLTSAPDGNAAAPEATPEERAAIADAYPELSALADPVGSALLERLSAAVAFATAVWTALAGAEYPPELDALSDAFAVAIGYALDQKALTLASVAFDVALTDGFASAELSVEFESVELARVVVFEMVVLLDSEVEL